MNNAVTYKESRRCWVKSFFIKKNLGIQISFADDWNPIPESGDNSAVRSWKEFFISSD